MAKRKRKKNVQLLAPALGYRVTYEHTSQSSIGLWLTAFLPCYLSRCISPGVALSRCVSPAFFFFYGVVSNPHPSVHDAVTGIPAFAVEYWRGSVLYSLYLTLVPILLCISSTVEPL